MNLQKTVFKAYSKEDFFKMLEVEETKKCMESLERYAMYETNHLNMSEIDDLMYKLEKDKIFTMYNDMGYIEIFN